IMLFMPKFKSIHQLSLVLLIVWTATFYYHERYTPSHVIRKCQWPSIISEQDVEPPKTSRMLLVADPQLIDSHTYPGRNNLLLKLSQHTVDAYIKKNYHALLSELSPDYVVFLGDLLDNGRESTDTYFYTQLRRFNKIFYDPYKSVYQKGINWFVNLPGNHDIGFGDGVNKYSRERFNREFAPSNIIITLDGVDFVMLDTPSISATSDISYPATQFLQEISSQEKKHPRVLLSHVPLFRDPQLSCGIHREAGPFDVFGHGFQYQNTVSEELTNQILDQVKPDMILSGDDHDHCDIQHIDGTREITVKSISLAMGKKYPAVQLLSFASVGATEEIVYNTDICYMPVPYVNIIHYVIMSVISALLVLWWNLKQKSTRFTYSSSLLPLNSVINIPVESHSRRLKKFLKEQEQDSLPNEQTPPLSPSSSTYTLASGQHLFSIPNYTFTQNNSSSFMKYVKNSKVGQTYIMNRRRVFTFMKRWNLFSFLKNSMMLGISVIGVYYIFCLTI
ncbi:uncharacterized protein SPAPADRAFT_142378, partial [Spathaspora passalidarum NRRL Y-27907]